MSGEEHGPPDGILTLGRSSDVSPEWRGETKGVYLPRTSARIGFVEGGLLIVAFVLASPAMILLTIADLFDRSVASYERFIHRLSTTDEGPVDKTR